MKIIRYIRPTTRRTVAHQMHATERDDVATTVIEDDDNVCAFESSLMRKLRRGYTVLVQDLNTFGRKREMVCERLGQLFAKGVSVLDGNGVLYAPECGDAVISAFRDGRRTESVRARIPHNKATEADKQRALWYWQQTELTNEQVEERAGFTYAAMHSWFGEMYPRNQRRGRPRKQARKAK